MALTTVPALETIQVGQHYEVTDNNKTIALIAYDEEHLTQPWVCMVNDKEVFRANAFVKLENMIRWHHSRRSLPAYDDPAGDQDVCPIPDECAAARECLAGCGMCSNKFEAEFRGKDTVGDRYVLRRQGTMIGYVWDTKSGWFNGSNKKFNSLPECAISLARLTDSDYLLN